MRLKVKSCMADNDPPAIATAVQRDREDELPRLHGGRRVCCTSGKRSTNLHPRLGAAVMPVISKLSLHLFGKVTLPSVSLQDGNHILFFFFS